MRHVLIVTAVVAVGTALRRKTRAAPRADPSGRNYRTGLLPWVLASKRSVGQGWRTRAGGSQRLASRFVRAQSVLSCWLRRRSVLCQHRTTWVRNALTANALVGTA